MQSSSSNSSTSRDLEEHQQQLHQAVERRMDKENQESFSQTLLGATNSPTTDDASWMMRSLNSSTMLQDTDDSLLKSSAPTTPIIGSTDHNVLRQASPIQQQRQQQQQSSPRASPVVEAGAVRGRPFRFSSSSRVRVAPLSSSTTASTTTTPPPVSSKPFHKSTDHLSSTTPQNTPVTGIPLAKPEPNFTDSPSDSTNLDDRVEETTKANQAQQQSFVSSLTTSRRSTPCDRPDCINPVAWTLLHEGGGGGDGTEDIGYSYLLEHRYDDDNDMEHADATSSSSGGGQRTTSIGAVTTTTTTAAAAVAAAYGTNKRIKYSSSPVALSATRQYTAEVLQNQSSSIVRNTIAKPQPRRASVPPFL